MIDAFLCLAGLQVKHFVADFCLQSSRLLSDKGRYLGRGGLIHALIHGVGTALVLAFFVPVPVALIAGFGDALIHYHIDWAKVRLQGNLMPHERKFWVYLGIDQMLHQLTMLGIAYVVFTL